MDESSGGMMVALVILALMAFAMLGVVLYVMIRLVRFSTRSPWFMVEKDDRGVVQIAEMAVKAERDAHPIHVARDEPAPTVEMPMNDTGMPDFDSEDMVETGERQAG